jgi:hypothetical protein
MITYNRRKQLSCCCMGHGIKSNIHPHNYIMNGFIFDMHFNTPNLEECLYFLVCSSFERNTCLLHSNSNTKTNFKKALIEFKSNKKGELINCYDLNATFYIKKSLKNCCHYWCMCIIPSIMLVTANSYLTRISRAFSLVNIGHKL